MAAFFGEFGQTIDSKHRMAIPMALREQMDPEEDGDRFILALGPDLHLWLHPQLAYEKLLKQLRRSPLPDRDSRKIGLMFAMARVVRPDKQGRIVLPEKSMQRARVAEAVTLVGQYDHIEIWPTEEWEQRVREDLPNYGETIYDAAERLRLEQDFGRSGGTIH